MRPYSEHSETVAVAAVAAWLNHFAGDESGAYAEVADEKKHTMLMVASENGYPKVVEKLLKDEGLVKFELDARARELKAREKASTRSQGQGYSDVAKARQLAKHARQGHLYSSASKQYEPMHTKESAEQWGGFNGRQERCKSCYDMITLCMYIGEEIADVPTLLSLIAALQKLGWVNMDDIQDHWSDVRDGLRKQDDLLKLPSVMGSENKRRALVTRISEARYNYGSWHKQFKEKGPFDNLHVEIKEEAKQLGVFCKALVFATVFSQKMAFCGALGYATILSLIILVPGIVLVLYYHLVHYEEHSCGWSALRGSTALPSPRSLPPS